MTDHEPLILLTEPDELPDVLADDLPCPRCHAGPERRVKADLAGRITLCGKCGLDLITGVGNGRR